MDSLIAGLSGLIAFFAGLVALDIAAMRWGVDSQHPDVGQSIFERRWQDRA